MKTEEELIWEAYIQKDSKDETESYDYGCLMIYFDDDSAKDIRQFNQDTFNPEVLAEYGIEERPHITCQYGFESDITIEEIGDFVNKIVKKPISLELGDITRFADNPDYDVIKVDIKSPDLHELSDKIRKHFDGRLNITYPNYHPHLTLAYVKKGSLPHIDGDNMFNGKNFVFDEFIYSTKDDEEYEIKKD
jgi:2'-5' RNA ligase